MSEEKPRTIEVGTVCGNAVVPIAEWRAIEREAAREAQARLSRSNLWGDAGYAYFNRWWSAVVYRRLRLGGYFKGGPP